MIDLVARWLLSPVLVVAAALLVKGYETSGGGFAAGVVGALGILLQYVVLGYREAERRLPWVPAAHRLAVGGLALMAAVLLLPVLAGRPPGFHLPRPEQSPVELGPLTLHTPFLFEAGIAVATFGFVVDAVHRLAASGWEGEG